MKLDKHKIQGLSLIVAGVLLWYNFGLFSTGAAMIISSAIIGINALMELTDQVKNIAKKRWFRIYWATYRTRKEAEKQKKSLEKSKNIVEIRKIKDKYFKYGLYIKQR